MKVIEQSVEILTPLNGEEILKHIEACGRTCYKSESSDGSARRFVASIIKSGHESVLEHFSFTVRFITDRAVTHEIVRHRIASYSQESQRYCNYGKDKFGNDVTIIKQVGLETKDQQMFNVSCATATQAYLKMLNNGVTPEIARSVLPNCTKTELVMTANLREWRHFLKLRTDKAAHPQIRALATDLLNQLKAKIPVVFDDIEAFVPAAQLDWAEVQKVREVAAPPAAITPQESAAHRKAAKRVARRTDKMGNGDVS